MGSKEFFKNIVQEFEGHPYKERFLEELEEHLEDYCEAEEIQRSKVDTAFLKKYFGEEKKIKKDFIAILDPWNKLFYLMEGLLLSLAGMLMAFNFFNLLHQIYDTDFQRSHVVFFSFYQVVWLIFYDPIYSYLKNIQPYTHLKTKLIFCLLLAPSFLLYLYLIFSSSSNPTATDSIAYLPHFFLLQSLMGYLSWKLTNKRKSIPFRSKSILITTFLVLALILGRTFLTHLHPGMLENYPYLLWPFLPLFFIDAILVIPLDYLGDVFKPHFYFPGFFLAFICLLELFWILLNKKYWLLRTVVFVYTFSFFFMSENLFNASEERIISQTAQFKEEKGIFIPFRNYIKNLEEAVYKN